MGQKVGQNISTECLKILLEYASKIKIVLKDFIAFYFLTSQNNFFDWNKFEKTFCVFPSLKVRDLKNPVDECVL